MFGIYQCLFNKTHVFAAIEDYKDHSTKCTDGLGKIVFRCRHNQHHIFFSNIARAIHEKACTAIQNEESFTYPMLQENYEKERVCPYCTFHIVGIDKYAEHTKECTFKRQNGSFSRIYSVVSIEYGSHSGLFKATPELCTPQLNLTKEYPIKYLAFLYGNTKEENAKKIVAELSPNHLGNINFWASVFDKNSCYAIKNSHKSLMLIGKRGVFEGIIQSPFIIFKFDDKDRAAMNKILKVDRRLNEKLIYSVNIASEITKCEAVLKQKSEILEEIKKKRKRMEEAQRNYIAECKSILHNDTDEKTKAYILQPAPLGKIIAEEIHGGYLFKLGT
jgi:hypothetical protein